MLKMLSLFSGIGAFEKALNNCGIPYKLINYCEIDKYASRSYSAIHDIPEELNLKDVTKINTSDINDEINLITYGFPCQDISQSGKQKGFHDENGNRTRSGLFYDATRIIKETMPEFAIAENVKALVSKKFINDFNKVLSTLDSIGYNNYWKVLNAKDYGIPQNRERVFIVSIRKDIDNGFDFPAPSALKIKLEDLMDDTVDEKYYLSDKMLEKITWEHKESSSGIIEEADIHKGGQKSKVISSKGCCSSLTATDYKQPKQVIDFTEKESIRVRKLTPAEAFKLMGFSVKDYEKAVNAGISNTQLYKQAGNSIVVNVLEEIYRKLGEVYSNFRSDNQIKPVTADNLEDRRLMKKILIAASRGRNPNNPSDRTAGIKTEQRLEINKSGTSNTITTVLKDNYVVEKLLRKVK